MIAARFKRVYSGGINNFQGYPETKELSEMMKVVVDLEEISGGHEDEVALLGEHTLITIDTSSWGCGCYLSKGTGDKGTKVASARLESKAKTRCAFRSRLVSQ